jgi:hypothetical protein
LWAPRTHHGHEVISLAIAAVLWAMLLAVSRYAKVRAMLWISRSSERCRRIDLGVLTVKRRETRHCTTALGVKDILVVVLSVGTVPALLRASELTEILTWLIVRLLQCLATSVRQLIRPGMVNHDDFCFL